MKVAVYARVSTTDKGQQVDRQISQLQDICQTNGWEITKEYIDNGISGTKKSRPALNEMMKDARQRKFKMIVCLELSRIARSSKHMLDILEDLKRRHQHIYIHNQGIDTSNYMGEFFATVLSALAQIEVATIAERIQSGIANSRRKKGGKWTNQKALLNQQQKDEIKHLRSEKKFGILKLAKMFSVSTHTIYKVLEA
mgnify:CR=1 FL=1